ncbi:MAG: TonB-dependent receptor, partial [Sphingobacteriaceae bacterium]
MDNLNYNINYRGVFGKYGQHTLSADADYSQYDRRSVENLQNNFFDDNGAPYPQPLLFKVNSPSDITVYSAKVDYTRLIQKHSVLDAGIKFSKVNNTNKIDFEEKQAGVFTPVAKLTDHFIYDEQINAAYVNLNRNFGKVTVIAGLRAEQTLANRKSLNPNRVADTSYFNIFPNVQVNYDINDNHQLNFSYNRHITRPNYQDLNPFVSYIDQHTYSTGNPFLRPQYMHSFQVADIYLIKFRGALSYNIIKDFQATIFTQNDTTLFTTRENIGTRHQIKAEIQAPFDLTKWWQVSNFLEATYERYYYNSPGAQNRDAYDLILRVNQTFNINPKLRAEMNANYETPTYFGIKNYREQYYFSAGVSYTVLSEKGNVRLAVSDIFNTYVDRYSTRFLNLDLRGREKLGTRFVTATFIYRFGNSALKNARRRTSGNAE